ncbi:hypothetical protein BOTCAL_0003g00300 [Botryotinia calthae]|uniref:Uncharacterized protein n=1 Tax=Botryotinia calthae TaxID=38488 RepID=A0A4Y8DHK4_9HELO|nr:hypothetical protein BOTCAL_0003g00300 [Botryotinia calthae]
MLLKRKKSIVDSPTKSLVLDDNFDVLFVNKPFTKEKAPPKDEQDRKKVKDLKTKGVVTEAKEAKLLGKDGKERVKAVTGDEAQEVLMKTRNSGFINKKSTNGNGKGL